MVLLKQGFNKISTTYLISEIWIFKAFFISYQFNSKIWKHLIVSVMFSKTVGFLYQYWPSFIMLCLILLLFYVMSFTYRRLIILNVIDR